MVVASQVGPSEGVAMQRRALEVATGKVRIPLACPKCGTSTLDTDEAEVRCINGHVVKSVRTLHTQRKRRIARYIGTGEL